jgi:multicomponent Na+:H+ antiporter subunit G
MILDVISGLLLAAGALFLLTGAVGVVRLPDFFTRVHAAGITDTAGAGLILLGLLLRSPGWETSVRLAIIMLALVITAPTATHILVHAARRDGVPVWREGDRRR